MLAGESAGGIQERGPLGHVGHVRGRARPPAARICSAACLQLAGVDVDESHGRPVLCEPHGDRTAQAAPGARDQHGLLGNLSDR